MGAVKKKTKVKKKVVKKPTKKINNIIESLEPLAVDLDDVMEDPKNARKHGPKNLKSIETSLSKFGQVKPIVVNKQGNTILAGNGTYAAAAALGWTKIAAVFVDMDDTDAKGYALADNRTAELAEWELFNLSELVKSLDDEGWDFDLHGWEDYELEPLLAAEFKGIEDPGWDSKSSKEGSGDPEDEDDDEEHEPTKRPNHPGGVSDGSKVVHLSRDQWLRIRKKVLKLVKISEEIDEAEAITLFVEKAPNKITGRV